MSMIPLIIIIVFLVIYIFITYNNLVKSKLRVEQSRSGIDIYLKQRFDLIPNLVECVKAYCKHEKEIFTEIAKLRTAYNENRDFDTGAKLNTKLNNLIAVSENYPDLKANQQFLELQKNLTKMESQLQAARRLYNGEATSLNIAISTFPSNIVANLFNFQKEPLFELEDPAEVQNANINLEHIKKS